MFINKTGIVSQRQLPLRELIQYTQKKGGLEVYQDTGGTNIQDAWFYPTNIDDVSHDVQIKGSSVGVFDGTLYGNIVQGGFLQENDFILKILCTPTDLTQTPRLFSVGDDASGGLNVGFGTTSGDTEFYLGFDGNDYTFSDDLAVEDTRYEIIIIKSGTTYDAYVNGVQTRTGATISSGTTFTTVQTVIGWNGLETNNYQYIGNMELLDYAPYSTTAATEILGGNHQEMSTSILTLEFSEASGYTAYNTSGVGLTQANIDVIWYLNGSAAESQWGTSDFQFPKNLIQGYNTDYTYFPRGLITNPKRYQINGATGSTTAEGDLLITFGAANNDRLSSGFMRYNPPTGPTFDWSFELGTVVGTIGIWTYAPIGGAIKHTTVDATDSDTTVVVSIEKRTNQYLSYRNDGGGAGKTMVVKNFYIASEGDSIIPANAVNTSTDVFGDDINYVGNEVSIISTSNTFDRNPLNVSGLTSAGILNTEDITFEDITGDITRFYDNYAGDRIINGLVYSDFIEPIAGSIANFDGVLYGEIAENTGFIIPNGYLEFEIEFLTTEFSQQDLVSQDSGNGLLIRLQTDGSILVVIDSDGVKGVVMQFSSSANLYQLNTKHTLRFYTKQDISDPNDLYGELYFDDVLITTDLTANEAGEPISMDYTRIGRDASSANQEFSGNIYKITYYELDGDANRVNELMNYNFSEEKGLIWYNIAKNRPTSGNIAVVLAGSPSGTQFLQNGNVDYHHNLKYGYYDDGTSLVPGDIYICDLGFDVNGDPIDNLDEVKKYRKISRFLRR